MNKLIIPAWIALIVGAGCLYWDYRFHSQALKEANEFPVLEASIRSAECQALNRDAIIAIARRSIDLGGGYGDIFRGGAILFFGIGVLNFTLVFRHLRKDYEQKGR